MATTRTPASAESGVLFPLVEGRRGTQSTGRAVFADAVRAVDPDTARAIESSTNWHREYARHVAAVEGASASSAKAALAVARDGVEALHSRMVFVRDGREMPLRDALRTWQAPAFETVTVSGEGTHPRLLAMPYRGELLAGDALRRRLDRWCKDGIIEPSCAEAVRLVADNPDWLDASDLSVALVGAAAEMGPLESLSQWGAEVIAVDVAAPRIWERILAAARGGCGRLQVPVRAGAGAGEGDVANVAGADLVRDTPEIRTWIDGFDRPLVLGNYTYADGADFVRVAVATDAIAVDLLERRPATALAYLASPTDVYAVPNDIVQAARARRSRWPLPPLVRLASAGRLYAPNYRQVVRDDDGRTFGLADMIVTQQGPNYALAKRIQRWRAVLARETTTTSANVAPASRTRSVVKRRVLSAAYSGAGRFGVEIFDPATSRALMAALLIHDLRNPDGIAAPRTPLPHPLLLFSENAAHGGVWRFPYEPRSVLPLAAVIGMAMPRR